MMVEGTALLDRPVPWVRGVLRVRLLDVDRVDAPSKTIADVSVHPDHNEPITEIPFRLEVDGSIPENRRYQISAHLDFDGGGRVLPGDFITMEAFPWRSDDCVAFKIRLRMVP